MVICSGLIDNSKTLFKFCLGQKVQFSSEKFMVDLGIFNVLLHIKNALDFLLIFYPKLPFFIRQTKFSRKRGVVVPLKKLVLRLP